MILTSRNTIYNCDCCKLIDLLEENSIDLTVTSPPYGGLRMYNGYVFDYESVIKKLFRVTKDGGVVVWVVGDQTINGSESGESFKQALYFKSVGWNLHDTMIYEKSNFSNPSKTRYHQIFEYMFVFSKGKPKTFNPILDKKNKYGSCWGENSVRQIDGSMKARKKAPPREFGMRTNIWRMNTVGQESPCKAQAHPAAFPYKLAYDQILSWSNPGDLVFDPMAGSGRTGWAAYDLNRDFILCDISLEYCNLIKNSLQSRINTDIISI